MLKGTNRNCPISVVNSRISSNGFTISRKRTICTSSASFMALAGSNARITQLRLARSGPMVGGGRGEFLACKVNDTDCRVDDFSRALCSNGTRGGVCANSITSGNACYLIARSGNCLAALCTCDGGGGEVCGCSFSRCCVASMTVGGSNSNYITANISDSGNSTMANICILSFSRRGPISACGVSNSDILSYGCLASSATILINSRTDCVIGGNRGGCGAMDCRSGALSGCYFGASASACAVTLSEDNSKEDITLVDCGDGNRTRCAVGARRGTSSLSICGNAITVLSKGIICNCGRGNSLLCSAGSKANSGGVILTSSCATCVLDMGRVEFVSLSGMSDSSATRASGRRWWV